MLNLNGLNVQKLWLPDWIKKQPAAESVLYTVERMEEIYTVQIKSK